MYECDSCDRVYRSERGLQSHAARGRCHSHRSESNESEAESHAPSKGSSIDFAEVEDPDEFKTLNEGLGRFNLWISPELRVIVCLECQYYLLNPPVHLKTRHCYQQKDLRKTDLSSLLKRCAALVRSKDELQSLQKRIRDDAVLRPPFENIELVNGLRCCDCGYVCGTQGTFDCHRKRKCKGARAEPAQVQSFFKAEGRVYFQVLERVPEDRPSDDDLDCADREELEKLVELCEDDSGESDSKGVPNIWLERTLWHLYGSSDNSRQVEMLSEFHDLWKDAGADEEHLVRIGDAVDGLLYGAIGLMAQTPIIYLRQLRSPRADITAKPLHPKQDPETHKFYFSLWKRLLFFIIRVHRSGIHDTGMRISSKLKSCIDAATAGSRQLPEHVLNLSLAILSARISVRDRFRDPFLNAMAVRGWNVTERRWRAAERYTTEIAAMVFCCRLLVLRKAWMERTAFLARSRDSGMECSDDEADDDADAVFDSSLSSWRKHILEDGCGPVAELLSQLALGQAIAKASWVPGKLWWNEDQTGLWYGDEYFDLRKFRTFVGDILTKAEAVMSDLLLGYDSSIASSLDLSALRDLPSNLSRNFSFLRHAANRDFVRGSQEYLLRKVLKEPILGDRFFVHSGKGRRVVASAAQSYNSSVSQFLDLLAVVMLITSGQPFRGTELSKLLAMNTSTSVRNIFVVNSQVMILTSYNKTQSISGRVKCIARFLPPRASALYVLYASYVDPFARYLRKASGAINYGISTSLFPQDHNRRGHKSADRLSEILSREARPYMDFDLQISKYRQIATGISRLFVEEMANLIDREVEEAETAFAASRGHSVRVATKTYGLSAEALGIADERLMVAYRRAAIYWQHFIGAIQSLPAWITRPNALLVPEGGVLKTSSVPPKDNFMVLIQNAPKPSS